MSFMKGDLLTRTRKLVKGFAKAEPIWLKAMEQAPPVTFPCFESHIKQIFLPEDIYVKKFYKKHLDSKHEDAIKAEKKGKKKAHIRLKQIAHFQGKKPPPNPYPSGVKKIQAKERKFIRDRFFNPNTSKLLEKLKEGKAAEMQDG